MSAQLQVTGEAKIRDIQGPVVANSGVITALDGAASQYVRGDGTLADFPTSSGGGSSVSYYLNSSVSQGTIGGVAYRELSKEPIIGAGTDIAISSNGYVASYLTDANDPDVILIPGGNFNCEFYFSVNNNTGSPTTYAELYKYDGTNFTLLGSSVGVPESINQGTTIAPYYFAIPVATATLALTDRLAIRIYVNVDGRTVTLHTENGHLCQVVTTLSKGMVSLNNLTDQSQFLTTGTSGTNFAIVSSGDTHTFNLPVASATNTGKLSSTDWSVFNNKQAALSFTAPLDNTSNTISIPAASASVDGYLDNADWTTFNNKQNALTIGNIASANTTYLTITGGAGAIIGSGVSIDVIPQSIVQYGLTLTTTGTSGVATLVGATLNIPNYAPDLSGYVTLATTQTISGLKTFSATNLKLEPTFGTGAIIDLYQGTFSGPTNGFTSITSSGLNLRIIASTGLSTSKNAILDLSLLGSTERTYSFPDATGTLALTSNLSAYLPLTGGTLTGALTGTSAIFSSNVEAGTSAFGAVGGFLINYSANASSKKWKIVNDQYVFGDFDIQQSTTQTGNSYSSRLYINNTGSVGIGTITPTSYGAGYTTLAVNNTSGGVIDLMVNGTRNGTFYNSSTDVVIGTIGSIPLNFRTNNTEKMRLDASGNLGLGVTPSAWVSPFISFGIGTKGAALSGRTDVEQANFSSNWFFDGASKYIITGYSTLYQQTSGQHIWFTAPSGTAGNAISFTQAMTLASTGNLLVGTTTDAGYKLDVNGTGRFTNTLRIEKSIAYGIYGADGYSINAINTSTSTSKAGNIAFIGYSGNGTSPYQWGYISGEKDSATGDGSYAGSLTFYTTSGGAGGEANSASYKRLTISGTGAATFSSSVTATSFFESSDSRLKTLIEDNYQTKGIATISPKLYTKNGKVELGYYAQDVVGILDSAISKGSDDMLSLSYREVHTAKIYALEQRIKELESKLN